MFDGGPADDGWGMPVAISSACCTSQQNFNSMKYEVSQFKNIHLTVTLLFLAIMLTGCSSTRGPRFSELNASSPILPVPDKGLVFVYSHDLPLGKSFNVWANGSNVSSQMGYNKFFYFYAAPGELHLTSEIHYRVQYGLVEGWCSWQRKTASSSP